MLAAIANGLLKIRVIMLVLLAVATAVFFFFATQVEVRAGFKKGIPLEHEYMQTFLKWEQQFGGANKVLIALINKKPREDGIFNETFLTKLQGVTDAISLMNGVDKGKVSSIFTPDVRYVEVVEGGFAGGNVVPAEYQPTPKYFEIVKQNVVKAGVVGRLVTKDFQGAMVNAEFVEVNPQTGERLDYTQAAADLEEKIRDVYQDENIGVHIIGFAKVIGDITEGAKQVGWFFLITVGMAFLLLLIYSGSLILSVLPLVCSIIAVIWQFGLLVLAGFGLDPMSLLVPFLVLAIGISHGVQMINAWAEEMSHEGSDAKSAASNTLQKLMVPGTVALISDTLGFATILFIQINMIQEMAMGATMGVAVILVTNLVLMPILLSYVKIRNIEKFRASQIKRQGFGEGLWQFLASLTEKKNATVMLLVVAVLLGFGLWKQQDMKIGDSDRGVPELWPDSRYNQDSNKIADNFAIGVDIIQVIVEANNVKVKGEELQPCIVFEPMETIERFAWHLENTKGVQSVISLAQIARQVNAGWSEGSLKWKVLPRNRFVMSQSTSPIETKTGLLNDDCTAMPIFIFTEDHKADTISHVVEVVKAFNAEFGTEDLKFMLATGNVGVMAATNEEVAAQQNPILMLIYSVIVVLCLLSFRSLGGMLCVVMPLALVSALAYATMALYGIGLKVSTLPVAALGVGIGVDYGIYIFSVVLENMRQHNQSLRDSFYNAFKATGKAVIFTAVTLSAGVGTWLFATLKFQADMGFLLAFMFLVNMLGAVLVLPALAHFLIKDNKSA